MQNCLSSCIRINSFVRVIALSLLSTLFTACNTARSETMSADASGLHSLYDMTPVSATNPVLATVKDCGIEIPVSEFRAYVEAQPKTMPMTSGTNGLPLTLEQKRAPLQNLINEHLLMWLGYQQKADQTPDIAHLLEVTRAMLMREYLVAQDTGNKPVTTAEYQQVRQKLIDQSFNQTDVTVSDDAYQKLKAALKFLRSTGENSPAQTNLFSDPALNKLSPPVRQAVEDSVKQAIQPSILNQLTPEMRNSVFARCKVGFITIGDVLDCYRQMPPDKRPDLERPAGVNQILEQMFAKSLLTEEVRKRGLEKSPMMLEKLQLNRNMLVRLYALNQFAREATARAKEPGEQARVKQWYQAHLKDRYTYKDANGKEQVIPFEGQYERIEDDFVDDLREKIREQRVYALRKAHKIRINEPELKQLQL